jgi:hypothetical protein
MSALALLLLAGIAPSGAFAADSAYTYRPYGQQNQAGSDRENSPANSSGRVPAEPRYAPAGNVGAQTAAPVDRGDARRSPPPGQTNQPEQDDQGDAYRPADRSPPPPAGEPARPAGSPANGLLEATASAPDRSVPYGVREQDARRAAIKAWRDKAARHFGPEFSHWRIAERRHVDCVRDRGDDAVCTVSGVPTRGGAGFDSASPDDRD